MRASAGQSPSGQDERAARRAKAAVPSRKRSSIAANRAVSENAFASTAIEASMTALDGPSNRKRRNLIQRKFIAGDLATYYDGGARPTHGG